MGKCSKCKKITEKIITVHYKLSYKEILSNFININNIDLCDIDILKMSIMRLK